MQVVSSKWTLALKLLLPTFWFATFGAATVVIFFMDLSNIGDPFTPTSARLTMFSFLVSTIGVYYLLFFRIKWVAIDQTHLYVSNFRDSYKYTLDSVNQIEETNMLLFKKVTIHFHKSGKFGKSILFFSSYYWHYYLKKNPEILKQLLSSLEQK